MTQQPDPSRGRPDPLDVPTILATLRFLRSGWISDDNGNVSYLDDVIHNLENGYYLDGACCPMCQEVQCDDGCPLEAHRWFLVIRPPSSEAMVRAEDLRPGAIRCVPFLLSGGHDHCVIDSVVRHTCSQSDTVKGDVRAALLHGERDHPSRRPSPCRADCRGSSVIPSDRTHYR